MAADRTDNYRLLFLAGLLQLVEDAVTGRKEAVIFEVDGHRWAEPYDPWDRLTDDFWVQAVRTLDNGDMNYHYFIGQVRTLREQYAAGQTGVVDRLRALRQSLTLDGGFPEGKLN